MTEETGIGDLCLGVDVGGTFTDAVLSSGPETWRAKSPTTSDDLGVGVLRACRLLAERRGESLEVMLPQVARFGMGTTAVTNALAARSGRRVGLLTTRGFELHTALAQGRKLRDEQGWLSRPDPIVPLDRVVGVDERLDRFGWVVRPLDEDAVRAAVTTLVEDEKVESLAISFLWSFRNPTHEERAAAIVADLYPRLPVAVGALLNPVIREYERTTFAVLNAYAADTLGGIERLTSELAQLGLSVPVFLVHSGGGSVTVTEAKRIPIALALSGPAAGVAASIALAEDDGLRELVTCDMGGTSFDIALVTNGEAERSTRGDLVGTWTSLPHVDVVSIGAGGGSIGWVDARGMLRVGPRSAGAHPGPACYRNGGTAPTVTDALLVLGYLDPTRFLGGEVVLDVDAARAACAVVGERLGLSINDTAWGIRRLALEGMARAVRSRLTARGLDPRRRTLLSFGGCGGLFTSELARLIGARRVIVPQLASVWSAFGAATADIRRERSRTLGVTLPAELQHVEKVATELLAEVESDLTADLVMPTDRSYQLEADMKFARQVWELTISFPRPPLHAEDMTALVEDFRAQYAHQYGAGSIAPGAPVELVNLRVIGTGATKKPILTAKAHVGSSFAVSTDLRDVRMDRGDGPPTSVPTYTMTGLRQGDSIAGPCLLDGSDTTIWLPPDADLSVQADGNLDISIH